MKDSVITAADKTREIIIFLVCLLAAFLINAGAVIYYHTPASELFTQIGYVTVIGICFYLLTVAVRLLVKAFKLIFGRK